MKGQYILLMHLPTDSRIRIGKKGFHDFPKGYYVYVGSAMNSIEKRVERHKRSEKKLFWHIDYFLTKANIVDVRVFESKAKSNECRLAKKMVDIGKVVVDKFGSSDCRCRTHLFFLSKKKDFSILDL
jgi:Uri superfamily endonuclease